MSDILKAYDFIKDRYDWSGSDIERWSEFMDRLPMANFDNVIDLMESFAEYHVTKALEAAGIIADSWENSGELKPEIINAYPLTNIK